uniref:Probable histone-lysine N-methyltransferase set-23 n=1 Tax=Culex pipiens TaxID=7175 RepID=A0A8D8IYL3_CULPI
MEQVPDVFGRGSGVVRVVGGREILEVEDEYEHVEAGVEYWIENQPQEDDGSEEFVELLELLNTSYGTHCHCSDSCQACLLGGSYTSCGNELVLARNQDVIFECSEDCHCQPTCWNRLVQFGPRKNLEIKSSLLVPNQLGVFTVEPIPRGAFICEYAGEILTRPEAEKRNRFNDTTQKKNYVLCLNELSSDSLHQSQTFIDPERRGNIGRYLNHGCDPNCRTVSVHIGNPPPRIGIFARQYIPPGTELLFDYAGGQPSGTGSTRCLCGAPSCRGWLPCQQQY